MALLRSLIMKLEWFARKYLPEYNQSNLCVLDHFGTFMTCSARFLLEVSEPVSLKVTTEDYFRGKKMSKLYIFDTIALDQKRRSVTKGIYKFLINWKLLYFVQPSTFLERERDFYKN